MSHFVLSVSGKKIVLREELNLIESTTFQSFHIEDLFF